MWVRRGCGGAAAVGAVGSTATLVVLVLLLFSHGTSLAAARSAAAPASASGTSSSSAHSEKLQAHSTAVSVVPAGSDLVQYAISCPASETDHQLFLPARTDGSDKCSAATDDGGAPPSSQNQGRRGKRRSNLTHRALARVRDLAAMSRPKKRRGGGGSSGEATKALTSLRQDLATALAEGEVAADDLRILELGQLLANDYHATATETEEDQLEREEAHHLCSTESVFALLSNGSFCKLDLSQPSGVEWCNQYDPLVVTQSDQSQPSVAIGFEDGAVYLDKGGAFAALDMKVNDFPQHYETETMHFSRSTTHCHEVVGLRSGRIFKGCKGSTADARLPHDDEDTFSLWLTKHTILGQSLDTSEMLLNLSWTQYVLMDRVLSSADLQDDAWYHGRVFYSTNVTHLAFGSIPGAPLWEDSFEAPVVSILQLRSGKLYQLPHHHFFFDSSGEKTNKPLIRLVEAAHLVDPEKNHGVLSPVTVISLPPADVSVPLIAHVDGNSADVDFQIHRAPRHSMSDLQGMCEREPSCRQPLVALMLEAKKAAEGRRRLAEQIAGRTPPPTPPPQPSPAPTALISYAVLLLLAAGGGAALYVRQQRRRQQKTMWMQELQLCRANRNHTPRVPAAEPHEGLTLHLNRRLGEGADNTIVFEGTFKKEAVAIKVIDLQGLASREADMLRSSHNQHVVRYHLDFERENLKFIVMERCIGNLNTLARCKEKGAFGQLCKLDITRGMLEGLSYLHAHGIVHRDVKPSNVLIAVRLGRHVPVIADLGLSRQLQHDRSLRTAAAGTRGWVAPEVEGSESPVKITRAADVYSAGRVVAFLYDKPFKIEDDPLPHTETKELRTELIKRMTSRDPSQRPSVRESLAHKFCRHGEEKALADELMLSMMEADRKPAMDEAELADNLRIDLARRLGTGAANTAVFAGWRGATPVAVKCIAARNDVVAGREIQQLHDAHNHNVIRYYQHHTVHNVMCIVLEKCLCSLSDLAAGNADGRRAVPSVRLSRHAIVEGMLRGLAYLHRHCTAHCDIKPSNVLIAVRHKQHVPVIADFGLSRHVDPDKSCHTRTVGTPGWLAPEVDRPGMVHVTTAVDVYSAGKVIEFLYENSGIKLKPDECAYIATTEVQRDLISRMTRNSPGERPGVAACLRHPFFWDLADVQRHVKELNDELQAIKRDAGDKRSSETHRTKQMKRLDRARRELRPLVPDWHACFEDPVLKDNLLVPKKGAKYSSEDILDVVRVLRNKVEHVKEVPAVVLAPREVTRENLVIFFLEKFPTLLVHVHALEELLAAGQL